MKPNMANGSIVPHSVLEQRLKEAKEKEQWRHDFRVALFSAVVGGITGFLASLIVQWLF